MALIDSLISFWELEEASGTRIDAVAATGNDLTDNNTVTQAIGGVGNAAQFTAANSEFLSRASVTPPGAMTVALLVKPTDTDAAIIMAQHQAGIQTSWQILQAGGNWYCRIHGGVDGDTWIGRTASGSTVTTGAYQRLVVTYDGGLTSASIKIYKNNAQIDNADNVLGVFTAQNVVAQLLTLGAQINWLSAFEAGFDGQIDQVYWFNRVLDATELTWLDNSGAWRTYAEILAGIGDGDDVQVVQSGGIACHVVHTGGTAVKVVVASPIQASIGISGGTAIKVTI